MTTEYKVVASLLVGVGRSSDPPQDPLNYVDMALVASQRGSGYRAGFQWIGRREFEDVSAKLVC